MDSPGLEDVELDMHIPTHSFTSQVSVADNGVESFKWSSLSSNGWKLLLNLQTIYTGMRANPRSRNGVNAVQTHLLSTYYVSGAPLDPESQPCVQLGRKVPSVRCWPPRAGARGVVKA